MLKIILLLVSFVKGFFKKFFRLSNKLVRTGGFYSNSRTLNSFKNRIKKFDLLVYNMYKHRFPKKNYHNKRNIFRLIYDFIVN